MKVKNYIVAFLSVFISCNTIAQIEGVADKFNEDFWVKTPVLSELTEEEQKSNAVYIADVNITTYEYGSFLNPYTGGWIDDKLMEENLHYVRVRLNNDKAIESFNKVYISNSNERKITNLRARAITKEGKIIEFDDSNKKEIENYENYGPFTIFALEGIEVGSEIEYTYSTREPSSSYYFSENVQSTYPKRKYHYEIVSPEALVFKMKSYNGLAELTQDTSYLKDELNRYVISLDEVKKFKEEDYSLGDALKQRIEIKLFANANKRNFYSWTEAATKYSRKFYSGNNEKELLKETKAIKKLVKEQKWEKIENQRDQIVAVEHHLKGEFKRDNIGVYYIHECIKSKIYSSKNATRLFALIFDYLNISHDIVITSDRFVKTFDEDFETYGFIDGFLIYFHKYDQFMSPSSDFMRFGLISNNYAYNTGLFLKRVKAGGVSSAYPEIKKIGGTSSDVNFDNLTADIEFTEDFEKLKAHLKHEASGYSSVYLRPRMPYLSEEKRLEELEERLKSIAEDAEITNITSQNEEMVGYLLEKPYTFEGDAELSSLIEKAGNKYLFKMGMVIGRQVEMYQDTSRQFDVENSYNHGYKRVLNITIPEGYQITNLEDLNMDVFSKNGDKKTMEFTCVYEVNDNVLTVTCNEYYNEIRIPLARYEEFRSVINAAADFNKITLVFEKK